MIKVSKEVIGIIGLVVLGVAWQYLGNPSMEILTLIVVGVSGLGGYAIKGQVNEMRAFGLGWKDYYWRVLGYFFSYGGLGLISDELINGSIQFWPPFQHEVYGIILGVVGLVLISKKPHGK